MTTATQNLTSLVRAEKAPMSLASFVAAILMVDLREAVAAKGNNQQADAAFAYGL